MKNFPTYYNQEVLLVIANAIRWAVPRHGAEPQYGMIQPLEIIRLKNEHRISGLVAGEGDTINTIAQHNFLFAQMQRFSVSSLRCVTIDLPIMKTQHMLRGVFACHTEYSV